VGNHTANNDKRFDKEEILKSFVGDMKGEMKSAVNQDVWGSTLTNSYQLSTAPVATSYYANSIQ
jgi:hypothetical protein